MPHPKDYDIYAPTFRQGHICYKSGSDLTGIAEEAAANIIITADEEFTDI